MADNYQQALTLAKAGQYSAALELLQTDNTERGRNLAARIRARQTSGGNNRAQLQQLEDAIKSREGQQRSATIVFVFCLLLSPVGIGLILLPVALFNYFRHKRALKRLRAERLSLLKRGG